MTPLTIIIRCDASAGQGFGHLSRCLVLARVLKDQHHCHVIFAVQQDAAAERWLSGAGFNHVMVDSGLSEGAWLWELCQQHKARALIFDIRTTLGRQPIDAIRATGVLTVALDDCSDRRLSCDLVFLPPTSRAKALNWSGCPGQSYIGFEYMLIDPSVRSIRQNSIHHLPQLLVSMGGSDPAGITLTVLAALEHVAIKMDIAVVIGPGFSHHKKLAFFLERAKRHYVFHYCVTDMFALMREADLALISFGHTAAEAAAMGLPALYMCLTPDHAESAEVYAAQGLGINFGVYHQVDPIVLSSTIEGLLQDSSLRRKMARNGLQVFDGYGARRVAGLIMERIAGSESKHQSHFLQ